jgi:type I restriction enzyme, S subunit
MELKAGYKKTEVGVIPEEWEVSTVGADFEVQLGKMLDTEKNVGVPKPYLGNSAVRWGAIEVEDLPTFRMTPAELKRFRLERGDLLVCEGGEVGRSAIWLEQLEECYYQKALHRLRPRGTFDVRLMASFLEHWSITGALTNFVTQTSIAHLPREKLLLIPMAVPPLPEQTAITEALSDADALLASLDRLVAKKRDLKQAAMQQLLTGQTRLPGFGGEWEMSRLGDVAEVRTGPFGSSLHESDYVQNGTPIITVEHLGEFGVEHVNLPLVSELDFLRLRSYALEVGDIVFSRVGSVDRNALIRPTEEGWLFSGRLLRVRPLKALTFPPFLSYQFQGEAFRAIIRKVAVGQTMASLNTILLRNSLVLLPPHPEQTAIAAVLSDMDAEIEALEARRAKTFLLKQGMMQELLTGRIRLV